MKAILAPISTAVLRTQIPKWHMKSRQLGLWINRAFVTQNRDEKLLSNKARKR